MAHHEYLHELDFHGMLLAQISYYIPFIEEYELSFLRSCYDALVEKWPILQGSVDIRIPGFQAVNIEQRDLGIYDQVGSICFTPSLLRLICKLIAKKVDLGKLRPRVFVISVTRMEGWSVIGFHIDHSLCDGGGRTVGPLRRRPRSVQLGQCRGGPTSLKWPMVDEDCRAFTIGDAVRGSFTAGWSLSKETFRYFFEERIDGRVHVPEQLVRKWQDDCSAQGIRVTTHDTLTAWIARIVLSTSPGPKRRPFNIVIPIRVSALLDESAHQNVLENSFIISSLTLSPGEGNLSIPRISKQIRTMIDASKQIDSLQSALGKQARDRFSLTYPLTKEVGSPNPWLSLTSWDAIAPDEVATAAFTAPGKTRFVSCEELKVFPMFDLTIPNLKNALCSFKCPCGGYWLHGPLLTKAWDAAHADVAAENSGISNADSGLVDTKC
ncbi:hypothetical protein BO82DRAFT_369672 [Aspergillus uvarum CBS 121591]|uniref:Uncharacterized protein n=1 Tax=Aspergillus uvarum CBS 121591 TaxID=1448315 RepID=A0A319BU34_9EURO|nr:hypothetical protein BO82DRAFT_369672 [Aspergillus uvarum CBS 121591]PYH76104.1 hypothetical protein BO82DRAFT_369672 [Aspergillus uvarum CBS 121591]